MIAYVSGVIRYKDEGVVVIVAGGVGYEIHASRATLAGLGHPGNEAALEVHTHASESGTALYGFATFEEKALFRRLIGVSGVGPKIALALVAAYPHDEIVGAIARGDIALLTAVGGIGRKTAERIVIELKDKFKDYALTARRRGIYVSGDDTVERDALAALVSLGYSETLARRALAGTGREANDTVQSLIKKSLGVMAS